MCDENSDLCPTSCTWQKCRLMMGPAQVGHRQRDGKGLCWPGWEGLQEEISRPQAEAAFFSEVRARLRMSLLPQKPGRAVQCG